MSYCKNYNSSQVTKMLALTLHSPIEGTAREVFILIEKSSIAICNWMSVSVIYSHLVPEIQKHILRGQNRRLDHLNSVSDP